MTDQPPELSAEIRAMHARNVAEVNATNLRQRVCMIHPGAAPPARYAMRLPGGNVITVCVGCCAWWRTSDDCVHPTRIWELE